MFGFEDEVWNLIQILEFQGLAIIITGMNAPDLLSFLQIEFNMESVPLVQVRYCSETGVPYFMSPLVSRGIEAFDPCPYPCPLPLSAALVRATSGSNLLRIS